MRLAEFMVANVEPILVEWERFARSLSPGTDMDIVALRDHAEDILQAAARDMLAPQSAVEQSDKSKGHATDFHGVLKIFATRCRFSCFIVKIS
ncbi:MAG TPA: hypothetical protein VGJ81_20505 [Thermoanaerobaculia bacterium]|jgi:hypothetical protein